MLRSVGWSHLTNHVLQKVLVSLRGKSLSGLILYCGYAKGTRNKSEIFFYLHESP
jgi:hypothetical protein